MNDQPLVSVRVATYNHERWIAQCLEGVLMQRTSFPFEIIVGEDCSTDGTRAIVADYARRFPDRIRALLHETNLGPQKNSYRIQQACRGKYHAMIEGDDYWIDPLKLQKQVDYLEAHPEVSLCFHNALILNERIAAVRLYFETPFKEILYFDDICGLSLPTASLVARADILATLPEWRVSLRGGSLLFRLWCLHHGPFAYLDRIMSVYHRHEHGADFRQRRKGAQAYFADVFRILEGFNEATHFVHAEAVGRETARTRRAAAQMRWGLAYTLTHPRYLAIRLREYARMIRQKRGLFN